MSEFAKLQIDGPVARLVLNRPDKRNALTRAFLQQLLSAVEDVQANDDVRVLLLAAEGTVFCAGMDLGEMEARANSPDAKAQWAEDTRIYREVIESIFRLPIPTLAVLQGPVLAGGVGLVMACDIVVAAEEAFFALPEPKRGITAAVVTPLLTYRIGPSAAAYLLLSGENVAGEDALRFGLSHFVVREDALQQRVDKLVRSILTGSQDALRISKSTLHDCTAELLSAQLTAAMRTSAEARETADAREGLAAFLEKRPPHWQPKPDA